MKPKVRCHYWGDDRPIVNLGDLLVPALLDVLGYQCVPRRTPDSDVINPGRCLLVIGSLLTQRDLQNIAYSVDIWGCGWKGQALAPTDVEDMRVFAVRGPHTAVGLKLAADIPLGDPALLFARLVPLSAAPHGQAVLIPHFSRMALMPAARRCALTRCDEVLSPLVSRSPGAMALPKTSPTTLEYRLHRRWRLGVATHDLWSALRRIAGARFVLTGSLHGAILAQAFGVPWACYNDGYVDAPAKWNDWAAYLNIDIELVRTQTEGERWWAQYGRHGRVRDLAPLFKAFPYGVADTRETPNGIEGPLSNG